MNNARFTTLALIGCGVVWLALVLTASIRARENPNSGRAPVAAPEKIAEFAKATLNDLQQRSFANNAEYCGLMLEDEEGNLSVSTIAQGKEAECSLPWVLPMGKYAVATFHTHGTYNVNYDSEAPSVVDMEADIGEQIDGFIGTPGGRVWYIDWDTEMASQICGEQCIAQDPNYRKDRWGQLARSYTLGELQARQGP